jgi:hypothetical protein
MDQSISHLCQLLKRCELRFFHLEEPVPVYNSSQSTAELLPYLKQQQRLETLALITSRCDPDLASISTGQTPWPNLKALYLREWHENWLELLPKFERLQILSLQRVAPAHSKSASECIAKCRHLRVVDVAFHSLADVESLLSIARGCPFLQKFSVDYIPFRGARELVEHQFLDLLRALPNVEFLELGLKFRIDGATLQGLACYCPHLTVLNLPQARLFLSALLMAGAHPLRKLETMCLSSIRFEQPWQSVKPDKMHNIVEEWQRIFPRLRALPCTADISCLRMYTEGDDMAESLEDNIIEESDEDMTEDSDDGMTGGSGDDVTEDSDDDMTEDSEDDMTEDSDDDMTEDSEDDMTEDSDDDMTQDSDDDMTEDSDDDEFAFSQFNFRIKLWRTLGYGEGHLVHEGFEHMWQTNVETEIIGWPVVPISVFHDPGPYSTTAKLAL